MRQTSVLGDGYRIHPSKTFEINFQLLPITKCFLVYSTAQVKRGRWGDPDVDGRIILRWMFRKLEVVVGTGWSWLRIETDRNR
jgi:hypothetical protein